MDTDTTNILILDLGGFNMRDLTAEINECEKQIIEKRNLLNDTDYKLLRQLDGGDKMDDATKNRRKEARAIINKLEAEIAHLKVMLEAQPEEEKRTDETDM